MFRHRSFLVLLSASFISSLGDQAILIAFGLAIFGAGRSVLALGLMWIVKSVVRLVVQPFTGVLADRADRKKILVYSSLGMGATCAALAAAGEAPLVVRLGLIGLLQLLNCFYGPAAAAVMPSVVPRARLQQANGVLQAALNVAGIAGPALGGLMYAAAGASWVYGFDGVTFVVLAAGLGLLTVKSADHGGRPPSFRAQLVSGVSYVRKSRLLTALLVMALVESMVWRGAEIVLVPLATGPLRVGAGGLGLGYTLLTAGGVAGALVASRFPRLAERPVTLLATYCLAGIPLLVIGISDRHAAVFFVAMFACGAVLDLFGVSMASAVAAGVDENMRGRVNALSGSARALGAIPVAFAVTYLVAAVGYGGVLVCGGALLALSGAVFAVALRRDSAAVRDDDGGQDGRHSETTKAPV